MGDNTSDGIMTSAGITFLIFVSIVTQLVVNCDAGDDVAGDVKTTTRYAPDYIPSEWGKKQIPNPRRDIWRCGRDGKRSWVCDPEGILTPTQGTIGTNKKDAI